LWNANGLSISKFKALIETHILGFEVFFITECHHPDFNLDDGWKMVHNPSNWSGVAIIHRSYIAVKNVWKSDDGRLMIFSINDVSYALGYWPASTSKRRILFNLEFKEYLEEVDIVLGDFNWVEDKDRDRYQPSRLNLSEDKSFECVLKGRKDIALPFVTKSNKLFTYKHQDYLCSRLDRIYARPLANVDFINNLPFPEGSNIHCPVLFSVGAKISKKKSWKMNIGIWSNLLNRSKLKEGPLPSDEDIENLNFDSYIKRYTLFIKKLEKKAMWKRKKLICKAKALLGKIPKNNKEAIFLRSVLDETFSSVAEKKRILAGKKWDMFKNTPHLSLTRWLKMSDAKSDIKAIRIPSSNVITKKRDEILDCFRSFYENLYKNQEIDDSVLKKFLKSWKPPKLSKKRQRILKTPFSLKELEIALSQTKNFKAPGSDGLPGIVFKEMPIEGLHLFLGKINSFLLENKNIPKEWKEGIITTIFKKGDKLEIGNRRPITLLKTEYKLLSKMVTNRLNKFIGSLIHRDQIGFIPGRILYENVLLLDECLRKKEKYIISIDFQKAYDSISHDTLFKILNHINLPRDFTMLIKNMITGSVARVKVNDDLSEPFPILRGVKQGDPLSPLLFDLVIEAFAVFVRENFIGMKIGGETIKTLLYADDIILVGENFEEQKKMLDIMFEWEKASGLSINKKKSLHLSSHEFKLSIPAGKDNLTYLGFRVDRDGILKSMSEEIIQKIYKKFKCWRFSDYVPLGKACILNGYILSQLWFYSYIVDMDGHVDQINKLIKNFLWTNRFKGNLYGRTKMRKIRTEVPRKLGGLGIPNIKAKFNGQRAWIIDLVLSENLKIGKIWKNLYGMDKDSLNDLINNPPENLKKAWDAYRGKNNINFSGESNICLERGSIPNNVGNLSLISFDKRIRFIEKKTQFKRRKLKNWPPLKLSFFFYKSFSFVKRNQR
jgi:hypothetical protein